MSGIRKHDWPGLTQEWVIMKAQNPLLTQNEFFRRKGISPPSGNRRIGKQMTLAWEQAQQQATAKVVQKVGINLAEELETQLRLGKAAMTAGARKILPRVADDGSEVPAEHQPSTFAEHLALTKLGLDTVQNAIKLMTGGEAIVSAKQIKGVIEWVRPPKDVTPTKS